MLKMRVLPGGAPGHRLRHLAQHLHALGPRALEDFLRRLIIGETAGGLAITELLERHARFPVAAILALDAYELEPPLRDITWVIESDRRRLGRAPPRPRPLPKASKPTQFRLVQSSEPPESAA